MIYLDNAATSFPKPPRVIAAQEKCMRMECGNAGRGSHLLAMRAAERIYECREAAAGLFGVSSAERVIFTMNTTMALNYALKGLLHKGAHVLLSDMDHNATFRPIYKMAKEGWITYDVFPTYTNDSHRTAEMICQGIQALIKPCTQMLICAHASNICSAVLPLEEIGRLCNHYGILFVVDAAQSAGHLPIDMARMQIDALCAPGHKGLLGPQGSGILMLGEGIVADTLVEGGSGYQSLEGDMPAEAPERYEAGTLPTPALAGLCEGIRTVERLGVDSIERHARELNSYLQKRLLRLPKAIVYAPHHVGSVLLFNLDGISADTVGNALNCRGICVRSGYHCSALGHATLKTPIGGAVRVSPGIYNTVTHMDTLMDALQEL